MSRKVRAPDDAGTAFGSRGIRQQNGRANEAETPAKTNQQEPNGVAGHPGDYRHDDAANDEQRDPDEYGLAPPDAIGETANKPRQAEHADEVREHDGAQHRYAMTRVRHGGP